MQFPKPLRRGRLIKRYKRFLADVALDDGGEVTASCPNTGSMLGLTAPGSVVWLSESDSPTRKYRHTWEMIEVRRSILAPHRAPQGGEETVLVGINTAHPNRIVADAVRAGEIAALAGYSSLRREVRYGINSRIDLLLEGEGKPACYVEIKNVHLLREPGLAEFPDSVTERGAKHLGELASMVAAGCRAVMVFLVQRGDAGRFAVAGDIDTAYAEAFRRAREAGVETMALRCSLSPEAIAVDGVIPILDAIP